MRWTSAAPVLFVFVGILFCLPFLTPLNAIAIEESYLQFCSYIDLNNFHILRDHSLPFWAFHFGGGYPFIKHPDNISLSPLFYLLFLPFGTAVGGKLFLLTSYAAGAIGFYLLSRKTLAYGFAASVIGTLFFILNGFIPFQISTGNVKDQGWFYLPLTVYFLFRSKEDLRWLLGGAGLFALLILNGLSLYLAPLCLFLALMTLACDRRLAAHLIILLMLGSLFAAVKLFPILDLLRINDRAIENYQMAAAGAMTFPKLCLALFSRGPYAIGNEIAMGHNGLGMGCVMYFGAIPTAMLAASSLISFREIAGYWAIVVIFLLLSMADHAPVDIFRLLYELPLFHSIHMPARYFAFPVVFLFPLMACAGLKSKAFSALRREFQLLVYALALLGAADMFFTNRRYYEFAGKLQEVPPPLSMNAPFFSVKRTLEIEQPPDAAVNSRWEGPRLTEMPQGIQFYLLRQNIGLTNWYGNIRLAETAAARYVVKTGYGDYWRDLPSDPTPRNGVFPQSDYKGEAYFLDNANQTTGIEWRSNRINISIAQARPDRLIINQNYDKDWKSAEGRVFNFNGLLGVALETPRIGTVSLHYMPKSLILGLAISLITLLSSVYFVLRRR